jgi:hypothetical protein
MLLAARDKRFADVMRDRRNAEAAIVGENVEQYYLAVHLKILNRAFVNAN